jgi:hypothetical protein
VSGSATTEAERHEHLLQARVLLPALARTSAGSAGAQMACAVRGVHGVASGDLQKLAPMRLFR